MICDIVQVKKKKKRKESKKKKRGEEGKKGAYFAFVDACLRFSFSAFLIRTFPTNVPTPANAVNKRMTGILIAHSLGKNKLWIGLDSSTNG